MLQTMVNGLSNIFLAPVYLFFLALIPVVILLYLLKLRRTEVIISSTFLWLKSLQDLTANAPFQRLRKNLLLFLQILILLFIIVALARPYVRAETVRGSNYAVIIDASASMQTREGDTTRVELAKDEALAMVDELGRNDKMMVVSFAESADVLCELTSDKYRLRRAIGSIEARDTGTNVRDVVQIARSLAPGNPDIPSVVGDLQLVLFSDGKISDVDEAGARAVNMTYRKVGGNRDNLGIVGFSVRRALEGNAEQQTFVLVHNAHTEPLTTTLSLYFQESLLAVEEVEVGAGTSQEVLFAHAELGEGVLRAELDREDALNVDNVAWLALRPSSQVQTLIVSEADSTSGYYIKRALGLEPRVALSAIEPEDYAPSNNYDLTIFDGYTPESLRGGTVLFFGATPSLPGLTAGETLENPPVLAKDTEHPTMRFIQPENIAIRQGTRLGLPEGARTLLSTRGGAIAADVSTGDQQILVFGFDIAETNWPLRLSFPLFLQNVVSWVPRAALGAEPSVATGRPLPLFPAEDVETATVTLPNGDTETVELDPLRPTYFGGTRLAGVYEVTRGGETDLFAVNLLDRNESAIDPADKIKFKLGDVVAEQGSVKQTREFWRWLVLGALAILALEWWIYSRRAWS